MNINYQDIITIDPRKRSGKPCIRGLRITVYDILEYLALGMTQQEILEDFDYLTKEDIQACLAYAADREKPTMLTELIKELPTIDTFKDDPLETQRVMRNEWD